MFGKKAFSINMSQRQTSYANGERRVW